MSFERVEIGDAVLYRGDCMEILQSLPQVDAVITDPPYGVNYAAKPLPVYRNGVREVNHMAASWDESQINIDAIVAISTKAIIWGGNYYPLRPSRGWLTWFKPDAPPSMAHFEMAWTSLDKNARQISCSIAATNAERVGHPTQKPLAVMRASIVYAGTPGLILDPFMGSGTTGVAAIQAGCKFIGIERDERYFAVACERIANAQRQQTLFEPAPIMQQEALL